MQSKRTVFFGVYAAFHRLLVREFFTSLTEAHAAHQGAITATFDSKCCNGKSWITSPTWIAVWPNHEAEYSAKPESLSTNAEYRYHL